MPQMKADRIDRGIHYPCPRCRRGQLCPITLTEAFGCQKCQKIFVLQPDGYTLEQLSTSPLSHIWRWDGQQWWLIRPHWPGRYVLIVSLCISVLLLLVGLLLTVSLNLRGKVLWWIFIAVVVVSAVVLLSSRSRRY